MVVEVERRVDFLRLRVDYFPHRACLGFTYRTSRTPTAGGQVSDPEGGGPAVVVGRRGDAATRRRDCRAVMVVSTFKKGTRSGADGGAGLPVGVLVELHLDSVPVDRGALGT